MPEIPDLEAIRGFFNQRLPGTRIQRAESIIPVVFRVPKDEFVRTTEGNTFGETRRRAKFLIFTLQSGHVLVINAMLTGRFQYLPSDTKRHARTCLVLSLENGNDLRYVDQRVMGKVYLVTEETLQQVPQLADTGPDALTVTEAEFTERFRRFRGQIKNILTNHRFVGGIGNAYADEILFAARLHPYRKRTSLDSGDIARLYASVGKVFEWATPLVAEQMRDELNYEDRRDFLKIHRNGGEPCPVCGTRISEITAGQRITNFCRTCQPG